MRFLYFLLLAATGLGALTACTTEFPRSKYPPCERPEADPICGTACSADADCGAGFYCDAEGRCTADCDDLADYCGDLICDLHGRCVDAPGVDAGPEEDAAPGDAGPDPDASVVDAGPCSGIFSATVHPVMPVVAFVVPQSASMTNNYFQGRTRWEAVSVALTDANGGVVPAWESRVLLGVTLFTSHGGTAGGTCPELDQVEPALNTGAAIDALLAGAGPEQDSPAGEAIDQVSADLLALADLPDNPDPPLRLVLVVDNEPDTCAVPDPQTGHDEALAAVQSAYTAGIHTYLIALENDYDGGLLQELANAGAGLPPGGPTNVQFWQTNSQIALDHAFDEAVRAAHTCELRLDETVDVARASEGTVTLNTTALTHGTDWDLVDGSTISLLGLTCGDYLDDPAPVVSAEFPCDAILP